MAQNEDCGYHVGRIRGTNDRSGVCKADVGHSQMLEEIEFENLRIRVEIQRRETKQSDCKLGLGFSRGVFG